MESYDEKISSQKLQAHLIQQDNDCSCRHASKNKNISFVWATGGHARHGNLADQTYTAVLESKLKPIFRDYFHMQFETRNVAMQHVTSAVEYSYCQVAFMGKNDVDVVTWDFGMADLGEYWKLYHYGIRMGLQQHYDSMIPALWALELGLRRGNERMKVLNGLEDLGMTVLSMLPELWRDLFDAIPDTMNATKILPPNLYGFKCHNEIEAGDEICVQQKFTTTECPGRPHRVPWHYGWYVCFTGVVVVALRGFLLWFALCPCVCE